ncbi:hypothetical protein M758_12G118600 [Ceratodon purpureus]|nr:hypothetical protein M758_12G118600 [Ceratodon purpureus]
MLLHLWRQTLRIFNQVMASVEPKVVSVSAELVRLNEVMALGKEQLSDLTREHHACTLKYKTLSDKLKQVNLQFTRLQRCRLCLAENLTPRAREKFVRRATMKRSSAGSALLLQEELQSAEQLLQETLAAKSLPASSAHAVEGERGEGGGKVAPPESGVKRDTGEVDKRNIPAATSVGEIVSESGSAVAAPAPESGARVQDSPATATVAASPGDIIPGSPTFRVFKRISQGLMHDDGLHYDVPVQTDDPAKQHPFSDVLDRPKTAPARLNTYGMEIFEPMSAEEAAAFKKLKREKRLKYEERKKKGKVVENVVEGGLQENEATIKELAAETMQLLEQVGMHPKMANRFKGILAKLRLLQMGKISADGWLEELDMENIDMSFLDRLLSLDDVDGKKKGKRGQWGKAVRKGMGDGRRGSSQIANLADELMARRGSGRASDLGLRPMKAKDLPFVPLGFAKMMKINPPPKVIKNFNERQLLKLVEGIYTAKITADAVDDEVDNERQTSCEFVYDYMLNIYGLKGLAESAVHGVFKKIKKMMISKGIDKCHKVRLFQRFCGFDPARGYAEPDLYMYLKVLAKGQSKQGVLYSEQDDGILFLNCAQSDYLLDEPSLVNHFDGDRDAAADFINKFAGLHATTEKTTPELQKILKATQVRRLDFDLLMENVIDFNPSKEEGAVRVKTAKKIEPLTEEEETALENLFVAGDANQDGVLTFTEFREIISSAEPSISQQNALRMFRETLVLMPDGGDSISPKAFATVAHAHGIKAPTQVIFQLLKKTWDQIQDDVNADKMTEEEKKEEAVNLRVKLEELIASTSNVSEAVLTFRDFVLKFCGGKGDAEEKPDGGKEGNESDDSE